MEASSPVSIPSHPPSTPYEVDDANILLHRLVASVEKACVENTMETRVFVRARPWSTDRLYSSRSRPSYQKAANERKTQNSQTRSILPQSARQRSVSDRDIYVYHNSTQVTNAENSSKENLNQKEKIKATKPKPIEVEIPVSYTPRSMTPRTYTPHPPAPCPRNTPTFSEINAMYEQTYIITPSRPRSISSPRHNSETFLTQTDDIGGSDYRQDLVRSRCSSEPTDLGSLSSTIFQGNHENHRVPSLPLERMYREPSPMHHSKTVRAPDAGELIPWIGESMPPNPLRTYRNPLKQASKPPPEQAIALVADPPPIIPYIPPSRKNHPYFMIPSSQHSSKSKIMTFKSAAFNHIQDFRA
eukprot:TRINITY_DN6605_c0_g1_i4.p1 TRINITY_DN6605_c0_g1~~TRINITY_DN6605_c0_g1_i4.p1  ORF type:complete len:357 (-),score=48.32 TRINITY_DN6605_c0_g1_i4:643-1713(-)